MKILITGAAGFLGSELAKYFYAQGQELVLLDNMEYGYEDNLSDVPELLNQLIIADIRNANLAKHLKGVQAAFNFAGISSLPECEMNPQKAMEVNAAAVANLLAALRGISGFKRFIFASTSAVYENNADPIMFEDLPVRPDLIYATSKLCAEHICQTYVNNYGFDIIICRFFNVFGPHQDFKRAHPPFTSYLIREALADRIPTVFNTSAAKRDYIYVSDLINYLEILMNSPAKMSGDIFNLCSGVGYSALEILQTLYQLLGRTIDYNKGEPAAFWDKFSVLFNQSFNLSKTRIEKEVYKHCIGDNTKIKQLSGSACRDDLRSGLAKIVAYQQKESV